MPSVIAFQIKEANNKIDDSWKTNLDTSLLYTDNNPHNPKTYTPLDAATEIPGPGTIIALDAEFVAIKRPEIEVNSDGVRETIRPVVHALARVSVLRGPSATFNPSLAPASPFIDDYILSSQPIVDYLTKFSGLAATDLDPSTSRHSLLPLKQAYKKLWLLLNLGCSFLGHGLRQDFRVINMHVPRAQVVDTIESFFVASHLRKLSLAFLAWFLLKEDIQVETHDSIEDARTALRLWGRWREFVDAGVLDKMLAEIYRVGARTGFKPQGPAAASGSLVPPATPGTPGR